MRNHCYTGFFSLTGRGELALLAIYLEASLIRRVDPSDDLHQRAFPGSVLSDKGVNFAGAEIEVYVVHSNGPTEPLRNIFELESRVW